MKNVDVCTYVAGINVCVWNCGHFDNTTYCMCVRQLRLSSVLSLWVSHTGSASDWCARQEVLYKCIDTIQYNKTAFWALTVNGNHGCIGCLWEEWNLDIFGEHFSEAIYSPVGIFVVE